MNEGLNYSKFYEILLNMREEFHRSGRFDDSNAKLDEILKLLLTSYSLAKKGISLNIAYTRKVAKKLTGDEYKTALAIKHIFKEESNNSYFKNSDGTNLFGSEPALMIHDNEDSFADILIGELSKIDFVNLLKENDDNSFDIVNECFGHFVRENFRNNKEDGQYMTPAEITKYLAQIIVYELMDGKKSIKQVINSDFKMLDPTCGVGTLLIETLNAISLQYKSEGLSLSDSGLTSFKRNSIFGQDKVDRMVRMSKMNLMLANANMSNVFIGNSIIGKSLLDSLSGSVDLIVSNPPFGAEFDVSELNLSDYPFVESTHGKYNTIKSEILILDRSLKMLKQNGILAIIVPDSVVASKGIYSDLRDYVLEKYAIEWVIDLPSVTFAQAGTRTNTAIMVIRKAKPKAGKIKMLSIKDVGYDVKERVGVPVKIQTGHNEMEILSNIGSLNFDNPITSVKPSLVSIGYSQLIRNIIKPSFYDAKRMQSLAEYSEGRDRVYKLSDFVTCVTNERKAFNVDQNIKHVSVLYVDKDGIIDFDEVEAFVPICKGREIKEGDILFSKLNPRISRVCVVPKYHCKLVCSNEFEILRAKEQKNATLLCYILKTDFVLKQIEVLTSGTSSSHSRIQRDQLLDIVIPDLEFISKQASFLKKSDEVNQAIASIYEDKKVIESYIKEIDSISKN